MYSRKRRQRHVVQNARADELRLRNIDRRPIGLKPPRERLGIRHELDLLPLLVRRDELLLQLAIFGVELRPGFAD